MSITINESFVDLNEQDATALMETLQQRLVPRLDVTPVQTRVHVVSAASVPVPVPLAPKALPEPVKPARQVTRGAALTDAEELQIRDLAGQGLSGTQIAARTGRSPGTIYPAIKRLGITLGKSEPAPEPEPVPEPKPPPLPIPIKQPVVRTDGGDGWTMAQTKSLINIMSHGSGLKEAMRATGHSFLSCERRWRHLKEAGLMTMDRYLASPESTLAGGD